MKTVVVYPFKAKIKVSSFVFFEHMLSAGDEVQVLEEYHGSNQYYNFNVPGISEKKTALGKQYFDVPSTAFKNIYSPHRLTTIFQ